LAFSVPFVIDAVASAVDAELAGQETATSAWTDAEKPTTSQLLMLSATPREKKSRKKQ